MHSQLEGFVFLKTAATDGLKGSTSTSWQTQMPLTAAVDPARPTFLGGLRASTAGHPPVAFLVTASPFTTCCGLFLFSPTQVHGLSNLLPDPFFPTLPTFYLFFFFFFLLLLSPFLDGVFPFFHIVPRRTPLLPLSHRDGVAFSSLFFLFLSCSFFSLW